MDGLSGWILVSALITTGLLIYFLPTILARKDVHVSKIFVLNLLGAWTGILWIAAVIWALFFKTPKHLEDKRREQKIMRLVRERNGCITPAEVASYSSFTVEQAREELDRLCVIGLMEVLITENGHMVYAAKDFLTEEEKRSAKSPLGC